MNRPQKPDAVRARLLLIEPDPWRADSLKIFLTSQRFQVLAEEAGGEKDGSPELALVNLCDRAAIRQTRLEALRARFPEIKVLAFVREVDAGTVFPCLLLGVKGVLPFDARPKEIQLAIECVLSGSIWTPRPVLSQWIDRIVTLGVREGAGAAFTPSEQRVLLGLRDELSNKEIASRLRVTEATIKFHVGKLLKKTGTKDRRELARFVRENVPSLFSATEDSTDSTVV